MCGIAGLIHLDDNNLDLSIAASSMADALLHRGPDDCGTYIDDTEKLLLVHRRLSIQDLSIAGAQPMVSKQGKYSIVFNGEIYNFRILTRELQDLGYDFVGHSDTEVVLAAIEQWGLKCAVKKFTGMFAFALWDIQEKVLHLCRDRMGEKPLYYGWVGRSFYFSSELKAIESIVPKNLLSLEQEALTAFFKNGYINAPYSIYKDIFKLMPGTFLSITRDCVRTRQSFSPNTNHSSFSPLPYWQLLDVANSGLSNLITREETAIEELDQLLHSTVEMQKIADVSVGTFLSGGIDSSLVSAIAQAGSGKNIKTFTIGFDNAEYDESQYAEEISRHLGTDHTTVCMSGQDALDMVPRISSIYDEPFADSSQIPSCLVSQIARQDVTVCLSGDGGDELFAGYNRYISSESIWKNIDHIPLLLRKMFASLLKLPSSQLWDHAYRLFVSRGRKVSQRMIGLKLQKFCDFIMHEDLDDAYQYLLSYWEAPEYLLKNKLPVYGERLDPLKSDDFLERVLYWDQMTYLPGDNLAKVDRASMSVSLETRLPLLSHEMVEFSWRIPRSMKVREGESKWLLRKVLYNYVPKELIERPKMGFSVPVAHWLRNELNEWASDLFSSDILKGSDLLDGELIQNIWKQHIKGERDHALKLWSVLMFLSWQQR